MSEIANDQSIFQRTWDVITKATASGSNLPKQNGIQQLLAERAQKTADIVSLGNVIKEFELVKTKESPQAQNKIIAASAKIQQAIQAKAAEIADLGKQIEATVGGLKSSIDISQRLSKNADGILASQTTSVETKLKAMVSQNRISASGAQLIGKLFEGTPLSENYSYTA
jgi:hypothetical protein